MDQAKIVIVDPERSYALHLQEYLRGRELPFETDVCFSTRTFLDSYSPAGTALAVIAEEAYTEEAAAAGYSPVLILKAGGGSPEDSPPSTGKYQSMEGIAGAVRELCNEALGSRMDIMPSLARRQTRAKLIGFFTPLTRCLQTTAALTLGQLLSRSSRVLYLNFEAVSGLEEEIGPFRGTAAELLYYNECDRSKVAGRLSVMAENVGGVHVVPPMRSFTEMMSVTAAQWLSLMASIDRVTDYDFILLDLTPLAGGLPDILRECAEVITIIRSGCRVSEARVKEYRQMLKEEGYEDVYARTVLLELPVFRSLPADLRSLGRGELASYLKPLAASLTEGRAG